MIIWVHFVILVGCELVTFRLQIMLIVHMKGTYLKVVDYQIILQHFFRGTPMSKEQSHKSYRPLTVLTFRWNYWLGEANPLGYHFVNLVLHGLVTLLYFKVCRQLVAASVSLVASLLFALHPVSFC